MVNRLSYSSQHEPVKLIEIILTQILKAIIVDIQMHLKQSKQLLINLRDGS